MEPYNFKKTFGDPITLYSLGKFSLPFGIGLVRLVIAIVVFVLMLIFKGIFLAIGGIMPGLTIVLYLGIPIGVSHFLLRRDPQGKKLHFYLYDLCVYFFSIYLPKKKFANDEELAYENETQIQFEEFSVTKSIIEESESEEYGENSNSNEDDQPKLNVNKVG